MPNIGALAEVIPFSKYRAQLKIGGETFKSPSRAIQKFKAQLFVNFGIYGYDPNKIALSILNFYSEFAKSNHIELDLVIRGGNLLIARRYNDKETFYSKRLSFDEAIRAKIKLTKPEEVFIGIILKEAFERESKESKRAFNLTH